MRVRVGLALALAAAACGKDPGAVEATVVVDPNAKAQCLKVTATTAAGPAESTGPIARGGQTQFVVAIYPNATLSGDITVQALGFIDAACATQIEQSAPVAASFQSKTVDRVTLNLLPAACEKGCTTPPGSCFQGSGGCDAGGGCSYTPLQAGTACALDGGTGCTDDACDGKGTCVATAKISGTPCPDDNNPCTADLCDSSGHCTHPLLDAGTVCSGGNSCASAGTCTAAGQCTGIPVSCTTPPSQCFSDAGTCTVGVGCTYPVRSGSCATGDPCLVGGQCLVDGGCLGTPLRCATPPGQCFSDAGVCVDGGCAYPVLSASCATGDPCLLSGLCQADGGCEGTPMTCATSPGQCFSDAGSCVDGGCVYPLLGPVGCNTGDLCLVSGLCLADGGCQGTPMTCATSPGQCFSDAGSCVDGGCEYPALSGTSCTNGDRCVVGETCDAGSCGDGNPVVCGEIDCFAGACSVVDGGCVYVAVAPGNTCDGGVCANGGVCHGVFSYPPSNFPPGSIVNIAPPIIVDCPVVFDTTPDASVSAWCSYPAPPQTSVPQIGAQPAVLLATAGLIVTPTGSVTFTGPLPVILAVYGDAGIFGSLSASAVGADAGPDGYANSCVGAAGLNGGTTGGGGGGGGYATNGGNGGNGQGGGSNGGNGSGTVGMVTLTPLRGGCPGGAGGLISGTAGTAGGAGGALQVSAAGVLDVDGGIWAEGGGGSGASKLSGAGGAGSGGGILLEGDSIRFGPGTNVTANGGGGGQGGGNAASLTASGQDGSPNTANRALGGGAGAGSGGQGAAGNQPSTNGQNGNGGMGGGGGGGGVGYIRINTPTGCQYNPASVVFSPPANSTTGTCP